MKNINFATATKAQLEAAGYTVIQKRSQLTKRDRKSLFGVRPSMNNSSNRSIKPLAIADEVGTGKMRG